MQWTVEQFEEMRLGRPTYGEKEKSGALTWLRTSEETGGEYSLLYADIGPGYQVFPHYHTQYTETFKFLEGSGPGRLGKHIIHVKAGDEVVVQPRTVHGWGPVSVEDAKAVVELRPGHPGFKKWLVMLHGMAADGLTKPDLQPNSFVHGALFLTASDTNLSGPARVLNPVFKVVAWFARKAGVDRRLEEKYFHSSTGDVAAAG